MYIQSCNIWAFRRIFASLSYHFFALHCSLLLYAQVGTCESSCGSGTTPSPSGGGGGSGGGSGGGAPASPTQPTPTLLQSQVQRLAEAAERLVTTIRPLDPKPHNVKKKLCKKLEVIR